MERVDLELIKYGYYSQTCKLVSVLGMMIIVNVVLNFVKSA